MTVSTYYKSLWKEAIHSINESQRLMSQTGGLKALSVKRVITKNN